MISFGSHSDDNGEPGGNSDNPPDVKHSTSTFGVAVLGGFRLVFSLTDLPLVGKSRSVSDQAVVLKLLMARHQRQRTGRERPSLR